MYLIKGLKNVIFSPVGGVPYVGDPFVEQSVSEAIASVDQAINNTLRDITDPNRRRSPQELLAFFRLPSHEALQITRPAEIYERSLEIISQRVREGHRFNVTQDGLLPLYIVYLFS